MKKTITYKRVVSVLEANRRSSMTGVAPRDSDTELIIQILQIHLGANLDERQLNLLREINMESITRCRRKLQEGGEYLPSPAVAKRRRIKGWELMQTAAGESAAGVQRRIEEN